MRGDKFIAFIPSYVSSYGEDQYRMVTIKDSVNLPEVVQELDEEGVWTDTPFPKPKYVVTDSETRDVFIIDPWSLCKEVTHASMSEIDDYLAELYEQHQAVFDEISNTLEAPEETEKQKHIAKIMNLGYSISEAEKLYQDQQELKQNKNGAN